jgi:hypothetical protein
MIRARRLGVAALLCLATLGARAPSPTPVPEPELAPAVVLQRYAEALGKLERPPYAIFEYSVEQSGARDIEQTHRVYRDATHERDETLSVDGTRLKTPSVRVAQREYVYDAAKLAPKGGDYNFTFAGVRQLDGRTVYAFKTERADAATFAVSGVWIDARRFLPALIGFHSAGGALKGNGRITFAPQGPYWLTREAAVSARMPNGKIARERIEWSKYAFPTSLPPSTFSAPHAPVPESAPSEP